MSPNPRESAGSIDAISFPRSALLGSVCRRASVVCGVVLGVAASVVVVAPTPAGAYPYADVTLQVHGFGGGAGMGQWGALGYAVGGMSYQQILMHYYGTLGSGGTTSVGVPAGWSDNTEASVALTENANGGNQDVIVTSGSEFNAAGVVVAAGQSARFILVNAATNAWDVETSPGTCIGPWSNPVETNVVAPADSPGSEPFPSDGNLANEALTLCYAGGTLTVRGVIQATQNTLGEPRAENFLPLGQYVADVTPSESPASWGSLGGAGAQGQAMGFQELEAQAVAARSYLMGSVGDGGYFGANICDTTACQNYPGIRNENAITDLATTDTAGLAVLLPGGAPTLTQYSSSTGGYTAGGTFAPVVDAGDSVCITGACNPYHSYTVNIPVPAITAQFPQIGTLLSVDVSQRNGLGDFGGRVLALSLEGSAGTVQLSGDTFAADFASFGLDGVALSNWFSVGGQPSGGIAGYWLVGTDGGIFSFGSAAFAGSMGDKTLDAPMVGMAATTDHRGYWTVAADGGIFSYGGAAFAGSMGGKHLDAPMVGMAAAAGGGYWTVAADGGIFSYGGAAFAGSMGGKHLDAPMVGMAAAAGGGYWTVAADGGIFSYGGAAFAGSMGGQHLDRPIVGMAATPDGGGYWLVGADGGVFAFGDAPFEGSLPAIGLAATAVAVLPTATGLGYIIVTSNGRAVGFGDAPEFGDVAGVVPGYGGRLVGGAMVAQ